MPNELNENVNDFLKPHAYASPIQGSSNCEFLRPNDLLFAHDMSVIQRSVAAVFFEWKLASNEYERPADVSCVLARSIYITILIPEQRLSMRNVNGIVPV